MSNISPTQELEQPISTENNSVGRSSSMVELDNLMANYEIAAPCPAKWEEMDGDEKVRMCSLCQKNVYNISEIPPNEVVDLIHQNEGNLCVKMFLRADGMLINNNCSNGLRKVRNMVEWLVSYVVAFFVLGAGILFTFKMLEFHQNYKDRKHEQYMRSLPMGALTLRQPEQDTDPIV